MIGAKELFEDIRQSEIQKETDEKEKPLDRRIERRVQERNA